METDTNPEKENGGKLRHHPLFFMKDGNTTFQVNDVLFKVHRYFFERESPYFQNLLDKDNVSPPKGGIVLRDVTIEDFECLLYTLYPPSIGEFHLKTTTEWASVLKLATMWDMASLRSLAIRQLPPVSSAAQMVALGRNYSVPEWLPDAYYALCDPSRVHELTLSDAQALGLGELAKVMHIREEVLRGTFDSDVQIVINQTFGLDDAMTGAFQSFVDHRPTTESAPQTGPAGRASQTLDNPVAASSSRPKSNVPGANPAKLASSNSTNLGPEGSSSTPKRRLRSRATLQKAGSTSTGTPSKPNADWLVEIQKLLPGITYELTKKGYKTVANQVLKLINDSARTSADLGRVAHVIVENVVNGSASAGRSYVFHRPGMDVKKACLDFVQRLNVKTIPIRKIPSAQEQEESGFLPIAGISPSGRLLRQHLTNECRTAIVGWETGKTPSQYLLVEAREPKNIARQLFTIEFVDQLASCGLIERDLIALCARTLQDKLDSPTLSVDDLDRVCALVIMVQARDVWEDGLLRSRLEEFLQDETFEEVHGRIEAAIQRTR